MSGGTVSELGEDLIEYVNKIVTGEDGETEFSTACNTDLNGDDIPGLLKRVLKENNKLFEQESDTDTEGCFNIISSLISTVTEQSDRKDLIDVVASAVTSACEGETAKPVLRLKILTNFYNQLEPKSMDRFNVFMVLVKYAADSGNLGLVYRYIKDIDPKAWTGLELGQVRSLYKRISDVTRDSEDSAIRATSQAYIVKLLATYEGDDNLSEVKEAAAEGAIGAIKSAVSSFTTSKSLIEFSAVKQLDGDADDSYKSTFDLLKVFSEGNVEDYAAFHSKNAKFMADKGIEHETAMENMRLLSICSLASEHEEIPYAEIAKILQIGEDEVEEWVVKAITAKVVDAKMDQLGQVVIINRSSQRVFGHNEWKKLGEKLTAWKENVRTMLSTIENATPSA